MNTHPLNPITPEHIADYRRDGVVCLRQMFDADWIASLKQAADAVIADPYAHGQTGPSHGAMTSVSFLWRNEEGWTAGSKTGLWSAEDGELAVSCSEEESGTAHSCSDI